MTRLDADLDRHLPFDVVFNFRDLGGYTTADGSTVKWRTLFRADGVHRLTVDDLAPLGVRTVLDLRTPTELERGRFTHDSIGFHHLPILDETWNPELLTGDPDPVPFLADRYVDMLATGRDAIARALHILGQSESLPLVFHCAAGKDRTGVVAAVVLSVLGVSDDDIATDYSLSRLGMPRFKEWVIATYPEAADAMSDQPPAFLASPVEAMHLFLERVRSAFGSMHAYVAELGVTDETLDAVRANLLT
ncbi:MAG: protein-tyrosine phosphatase [Acidimicrobiaceae bacterium]